MNEPMTKKKMTREAAFSECRKMITVGSKSFSLAGKIFAPEEKESAFFLYGWCRYCDDLIDEAAKQGDSKILEERLQWLRQETIRAYQGNASDQAVFVAFSFIVQKYQIPLHYPLELLEGMAMDIRKTRYETLEDLSLYCYRVAGVVGLMMSHIMGVSSSEALRNASRLGMAMQLTNIARDIKEDYEMGRIYLPLNWLREEGISVERMFEPTTLPKLVRVVGRLLDEAESYYRSGDQGLKYLSFRPACAIVSARGVYSEIGREVIRRGTKAWDERVVISTGKKVWVMVKGISKVLLSIPERVISPWHRKPIGIVWRHI